MSTDQVTNGATGAPLATKSKVLETGASLVQVNDSPPTSPFQLLYFPFPSNFTKRFLLRCKKNFAPIQGICAHLNAFHVYVDEPDRCVEANHYCTHLNEDVRQCLIYDIPSPNARLIGIEYMISPALFNTLDATERKLWHSHVYEVKSGMLIMPSPASMPDAAWEVAETKEMEDVVGLYGKT
ncbi:MAG: hypothetical protein Q9210_005852, partial [Variospora velana]